MSNNLRHQMLESWTYPALENPLPGVDQFKGGGMHAGRLTSVNPPVITWNGCDLSIRWDNAQFFPSILAEQISKGDLVALKLDTEKNASEVHLLAPSFNVDVASNLFQQKKWAQFLELIREFFRENQFLEIPTPYLVDCPGTEPYLKPFSVDLKTLLGVQKKFLPTSPEINLKKYLGAGHSRIFELKQCFRNDEFTEHHRPEFMMLEWYRSFSNLDAILIDLENMLKFISIRIGKNISSIRKTTVRELFKEFTAFELTPETDVVDLRGLCRRLEIPYTDADSWDELFFRVFLERIESCLGDDPIIVRNYPPKLAAYSRVLESGWADRFELYWKGLEIANAFHELNNPKVQRQRMEEDNVRKVALGLEPVSLDEEFLRCLENGLPPSGGIALGVERLFMAFEDIKNIGDVRV